MFLTNIIHQPGTFRYLKNYNIVSVKNYQSRIFTVLVNSTSELLRTHYRMAATGPTSCVSTSYQRIPRLYLILFRDLNSYSGLFPF
jgi:hypothetical protein